MNLDIFKRNIQLSKLGISELDDDEKIIYNFLIENLSDLNKYTLDMDDTVYFGKSQNETVLAYYQVTQSLYVRYDIVSFYLSKLVKYESIILWWVEVTLGLKPLSIRFSLSIRL